MIAPLPRLLPLALFAALCVCGLLGCSSSDEASTFNAAGVENTLTKHGFDVRVVFDRSAGEAPEATVLALLNLYAPLEDTTALVADTSSKGAIGSVISAWVFDTRGHADSFQLDSASRLQRANVVLLVDDAYRAAAKAALDDLG